MAAEAHGITLPDLPEEILQLISVHFEAVEWASGPSMVCRILHRLLLPRMSVHHGYCYLCRPDTRITEEERNAATRGLLSRLEWAAKRLGSVTSSLGLFLYESTNVIESGEPLINAFSGATDLDSLRCLTLRAIYPSRATEAFCNWLLEHAAGLQACSLDLRSSNLEAGIVTMHHMRHLELIAPLGGSTLHFDKFCATGQLPVLETFCIHGGSNTELDVLNVAGCCYLRRLALYGIVVRELVKTDLCQLTFDPQHLSMLISKDWPAQIYPLLGVADHLILKESCYSRQGVVGNFDVSPCMKMLVLQWTDFRRSEPDISDEDDWQQEADISDEDDWQQEAASFLTFQDNWNQEAAAFLTDRMPTDGRPFVSLKCLIIWSPRAIDVCNPGRLPSLEELVMRASRKYPLRLKFEDPVAAFSGLKSFHAAGNPISTYGLEHSRATLDALEMASGLTLTAVTREYGGWVLNELNEREPNKYGIYLMPVTAGKLSVPEHDAVVLRLMKQCRCEACFECLEQAGLVDGWR